MCDVLVESVAGYNGDTSLPELVQVLVLKKRTITLLTNKFFKLQTLYDNFVILRPWTWSEKRQK